MMSPEEVAVNPNLTPGGRPARKRIGEILMEAGIITEEDLSKAFM
jgi:hypothetical protein